jgi:hypothetical protein
MAALGWSIGSLGRVASATDVGCEIVLRITSEMIELIDGQSVSMWAYSVAACEGMTCNRVDVQNFRCRRPVPGPIFRVSEGEKIRVTIRNDTIPRQPHGFEIHGIPGSLIAPTLNEGTAEFTVPEGFAGSYLYLDSANAPVNRVLGLHGAFVVTPLDGRTPDGSPTPYSRAQQTSGLHALFDALGDAGPASAKVPNPAPGYRPHRFPGEQWVAGREKVWVFNQIDRRFNHRAVETNEVIDPEEFKRNFLPRYFTINGLSGFHSASDEDNLPRGGEGQPMLIRTLNAGQAAQSPHLHSNHIFELAVSDGDGSVKVMENVIEKDTWALYHFDPAENFMDPDDPSQVPTYSADILLPFERPCDVPDAVWPPAEEPFPQRWVVHCHYELSQTAAGGNYPQGGIIDWEMTHPLGGRPAQGPEPEDHCPTGFLSDPTIYCEET